MAFERTNINTCSLIEIQRGEILDLRKKLAAAHEGASQWRQRALDAEDALSKQAPGLTQKEVCAFNDAVFFERYGDALRLLAKHVGLE